MSIEEELVERYGMRPNLFELVDCGERPGRVYASVTGGGWHVAFSPPKDEWPTMFIYVDSLDQAIELGRGIAAARKAGNVDLYVGRWMRENSQDHD